MNASKNEKINSGQTNLIFSINKKKRKAATEKKKEKDEKEYDMIQKNVH